MLFFERELELYVSSVNTGYTTANTVKLAAMSGMQINYKQKYEDTYNYKIENTPNRINEKVLIGYTNPTITFSTYAKPYNDTTNDTCVEKILIESALGQTGTEAATKYTNNFASVHTLPQVYLFIKLGNNVVYYIKNAVVKETQYKIDIDKPVIIEWELSGLLLEIVDNTFLPDIYTDFSNTNEFVISKHSNLSFSFAFDNSINYPVDKVTLFGSDYVNYGNSTAAVVTPNGNISIQTVDGVDYYDFGTHNNDTGRINITGAPTWTGNVYPNDGVGAWCFEADVFWDGTTGGTQNHMMCLDNNYTHRIYEQSGLWYASMYSNILYPGNDSGYLNFAQMGITANKWFHLALVVNPQYRTTILYIDSIPKISAWHNNPGDPGNASTGIVIGNNDNNNTDPWYYGGMKNISISWNDLYLKYGHDFLNYNNDNPINEDTILKITSDFVDEGPNTYTVTNYGCTDAGTYLSSPEGVAAYFTIDRAAEWNSEDWSISCAVQYYRSSGTYTGGTWFDDGVRRLRVSNNQLLFDINGSTILKDNSLGGSNYINSFNRNVWHWITFERKDGVYLMYIDGILRSVDGSKVVTPNTISSTGAATVLSWPSDARGYIKHLRVDNKATITGNWFTKKWSTTTINGNIPIVKGNVKLSNDLQILERNTLDLRLYNVFDHIVRKRQIEIEIIGYLKTGKSTNSISTKELQDYLVQYPDLSTDLDITVELRLGQTTKNHVKFDLPKANIELPEIKIEDVISSNITITSKTKDTINDDMLLTYVHNGE